MAQQLSQGSDPVKHAGFLAQVFATTTGVYTGAAGAGVGSFEFVQKLAGGVGGGATLQHAALVYVVSKQALPAAFRSVEQQRLQHGQRVIGHQATDT